MKAPKTPKGWKAERFEYGDQSKEEFYSIQRDLDNLVYRKDDTLDAGCYRTVVDFDELDRQ